MNLNKANILAVLKQITNHPESWNQKNWHCGTTHCFAGHAQMMSGKEENCSDTRKDARIFLGLSVQEADYLFSPKRSLGELTARCLFLASDDAYDRNGYDHNGYDRNGYDRYGYNCDGYDCRGYNRNEYNRNGYDCNGYNRNGYDRYGYDCDGIKKGEC